MNFFQTDGLKGVVKSSGILGLQIIRLFSSDCGGGGYGGGVTAVNSL